MSAIATLEKPTGRAALAEEVRRIRDFERDSEGRPLAWAEIARMMGISRSYASELYLDPRGERSRARKESYRGECVDCGGPTTGGDGPANAPERCADCRRAAQHEDRYWTPDTIIAAFREAEPILGRPPTTTDFMVRNPSIRASMSAERIAEGEKLRAAIDDGILVFPSPSIVVREFGSWEAALRCAGFGSTPIGQPRHWTRDRLIATLQRISEVLGRGFLSIDLRTVNEVRKRAMPAERIAEIVRLRETIEAEGMRVPSPSSVVAEFGSISAARAACGIDRPRRIVSSGTRQAAA